MDLPAYIGFAFVLGVLLLEICKDGASRTIVLAIFVLALSLMRGVWVAR